MIHKPLIDIALSTPGADHVRRGICFSLRFPVRQGKNDPPGLPVRSIGIGGIASGVF
jgi:hypothetical protein